MVFKLGVTFGHMARHALQLFKVKWLKVNVTKLRDISADKKSYNSAVDGDIKFQLGGYYRRWGRRMWYTS